MTAPNVVDPVPETVRPTRTVISSVAGSVMARSTRKVVNTACLPRLSLPIQRVADEREVCGAAAGEHD